MVDPTASAGSVGAGQQVPSDGNSDYSVTAFLVRQMTMLLDTMKVVKVVAVTGGGVDQKPPTVDVTPLVNMTDGAGNSTPHGVVHGLPVVRLQGGSGAIVSDPHVDDVGLALIADRDSSLVTGPEQVNPGSSRHHDVADGVYLGSLFGAAPARYLAFTADGPVLADDAGNVVKLTAQGITMTPAAGTPVKVEGPLVVTGNLQLAGAIQSVAGAAYSGAFTTTGDIVAGSGGVDQVSLRSHKHISSTAGTQTSSPVAGT